MYNQTGNLTDKNIPTGIYILLGVLCFVPLLGGFLGVALILLGLLKYKNKKLLFLGCVGLFFTCAIYSSLLFLSKRQEIFKQTWNMANHRQLKILIKDIEFYKLIKGTYPESLQQLKDAGFTESISDFIQVVEKNKRSDYYYKKVDDKYYLFSVGVDGQPFTSDDVLPAFPFSDLARTGLILNQ